jgi:hypothetical protein
MKKMVSHADARCISWALSRPDAEITFIQISPGVCLREMSPTAVCPRVTLTIQISETLFDALQITATMTRTTVPAFIGSALRETQIAFFAEGVPDVVMVDVRSDAAQRQHNPAGTGEFNQQRVSEARARGAVQRAVLALVDAGVSDLLDVRRMMLQDYPGPSISRALHQVILRDLLEPVMPTSNGFQPAMGGEAGRVRFVRRAA